jgi:hypothetical protein
MRCPITDDTQESSQEREHTHASQRTVMRVFCAEHQPRAPLGFDEEI